MVRRNVAAPVVVACVLAASIACTPTDVAVRLCEEQGGDSLVVPPDGDPTPLYRPFATLPDGAAVDARDLEWTLPRDAQPEHLAVGLGAKESPASDGVCFIGGSTRHTYSHEATTWSQWHSVYASIALTAPNGTIIGSRAFNGGDGFSISTAHAENWALRGVHVRQAHDDCIQNDDLHSGIIQDSFLDGCYVAFSAQRDAGSNADGSGNTVQILASLIRMQPMPHPWQPAENPDHYQSPGHSAVFKMPGGPMSNSLPPEEQTPGRAPDLEIRDTVVVLEEYPNIRRSNPSVYDNDLIPGYDPDGNGPLPREPYLDPADCSDNTIVWLGDGAPVFEPAPPPCFTILIGQEARDFWEQTRGAWLAEHPLAWQPAFHPEVFAYDELA